MPTREKPVWTDRNISAVGRSCCDGNRHRKLSPQAHPEYPRASRAIFLQRSCARLRAYSSLLFSGACVIPGVQSVPARVRMGYPGWRTGIALALVFGAVVIPLSFLLIADKDAADVSGYGPATATAIHEQGSGIEVQSPPPDLLASQIESVEENKRSNQSDTSAIVNSQPSRHGHPDSTFSVSGGASSASNGSQSLAQEDDADDMAGGTSDPGGRPLELAARSVDEVLHITNVGDRIVVTRDSDGQSVVTEPANTGRSAESATSSSGSNDATVGSWSSDGSQLQRPDYEDVYPGCPRVLPQGSDEQMALERQQLYGCLYYESCAMPVDDEPPYCTWHLIKKL